MGLAPLGGTCYHTLMRFAARPSRRPGRVRLVTLFVGCAIAVLCLPGHAEAQRYRRYRSPVIGQGLPDVPGEFTFCRLQYTSVRRDGSGNGWDTDFPEGERNFLIRMVELTRTRTSMWKNGEPGYAVVRATDPELFRCPFIMATDVGELGFMPDELEPLREYFARGGFFWADDFWGSAAWRQFSTEIQRLLPDYRLVQLTEKDPLFQTLYVIPDIPQIPSINSWRSSGGRTSEMGADSATPEAWAMVDEDGQMAVLITHNTDISDGWEREAYDDRYFVDFSPRAYAMAVNVLVWAMSR
jgi:hypothetical protein